MKAIGMMAICVAVSFVATGQVTGDTLVFTSRSAFDAAVGATTTVDFNTYLGTTSIGSGLDVGPFTITEVNGWSGTKIKAPPFSNFDFDVDGTSNLSTNTWNTYDVTLTFDAPITAFGADLSGFNDSFIRTTILAGSQTFAPTATVGNEVRFFGFISDTAFTTLTFDGDASDGFAVDNISFSSSAAVPAPTSTAALIGMGLMGAVAVTRRRRKTA